MTDDSTKVFSAEIWSNKLVRWADHSHKVDIDGASRSKLKINGDAQALVEGYTLFKVNGDEFASYTRANAMAEALMAFGESVNFQGYSIKSHEWLCFIYKTGKLDTVKIRTTPGYSINNP